MRENPTAAVLVIGDEILSGRTQDTHTNYIAKQLGAPGIDPREARIVGDVVYVMAGVPMIMRAMMEDIAPRLERGAVVHAATVQARIGEGRIAEGLMKIQNDLPELALGSYPYYRDDGFGVQLVARGRDAVRVEAAAQAIESMLRAEGAEPERVKN
jgi:molybdopterin-biosynthesis enzyme MoeA-like protein